MYQSFEFGVRVMWFRY